MLLMTMMIILAYCPSSSAGYVDTCTVHRVERRKEGRKSTVSITLVAPHKQGEDL